MKKVMTILAMFAMVGFVACQKPATNDNKKDNTDQKEDTTPPDDNPDDNPNDNPGGSIAELTIDGSFEDWAGLAAGSYSKYFGDEDSMHPTLTQMKVYATEAYIYVYFEYNAEDITHEPGVEHVPFHCYINTDGNEKTGGFADQFSDACADILLEGFIYPEGEEIGSYAPDAFSWVGDANGSGWSSVYLQTILSRRPGTKTIFIICLSPTRFFTSA